MDSSLLNTSGRLTKLPRPLAFSFLFLLTLPFLILYSGGHLPLLSSSFRETFLPTFLQGLSFYLGLLTAFFAFIQYKICNDKLSLIIGCALLGSGLLIGLNLLLLNSLTLSSLEKIKLNALIFTYSNSLSSCILLAGLLLLIENKIKSFLLVVSLLLLSAAFLGLGYKLPILWHLKTSLSPIAKFIAPSICLFLIVFIYPKFKLIHPALMTEGIFYMSLTQIVLALYFILATTSRDLGANFYILIFYLIPFSCLLFQYTFSYSNTINAQKRVKLQQKELKYLSSHDALTNLFNRREFEDLLDKSIANASRNENPLALLLMNLDNFNRINDTFGTRHGNELLKQFSQRLNSFIRKGDFLSRVGGDEFTIIVTNPGSPSSARQLAQRILNEIHSPYVLEDKLITMTASIGISLFPHDGNTTEDLFRKADLALYKAKSLGKNTFQFYTEALSHRQHREAEIESYFRKALLQEDEFQLYYQPKYHLLKEEIIGAEILLRWYSKALGVIPPDEFIPIAESTGLIVGLGQWVLRKACEQIVSWRTDYPNALEFAINLSPTELLNPLFLVNLNKTLKYYDLSPSLLEFEITEGALMTQAEEITLVLHQISTLGIKISLDDFGTAYSSLNRLRTLPIDALKIDKDFIKDIKDQANKVVIVDLIIKLAHGLGIKVIAEGIETKQQLNYLKERDCLIGQGRFLSKPLSAAEFAELAYKEPIKHLFLSSKE